MKNEEFVTFETAIKLKKKGYNWESRDYYWISNKGLYVSRIPRDWNEDVEKCSAARLSEVEKWLRDEKGIYICLVPYEPYDSQDKIFWRSYVKIGANDSPCSCVYYGDNLKSFEEVLLFTINYVIDSILI